MFTRGFILKEMGETDHEIATVLEIVPKVWQFVT
jgi:hypothetical protein